MESLERPLKRAWFQVGIQAESYAVIAVLLMRVWVEQRITGRLLTEAALSGPSRAHLPVIP